MRYSFPALSGEGFGHEPGSWLRQKNANIEYWNAYRSDPSPYFKFTSKTTIASLLFGVVIPVALLKWTVAERDRIDEKKLKLKIQHQQMYGTSLNGDADGDGSDTTVRK